MTKKRQKVCCNITFGLQSLSNQKTVISCCADISEMDGRVRRYAHKAGDWSVHVYIPIKITHGFQSNITELFRKCLRTANNSPIHRLESHTELHLSLSKTETIRTHQIDSFIDTFVQSLIPKHSTLYFTLLFFLSKSLKF